MIVWEIVIAAVVLLLPMAAGAAPAGKVIIAQGVDPTTLDMANQSESPASNVGRHIFDTLYERDQNLKIVPNLATEMPKFVPPSAWEVKLRKGVKFHNGEEFNADSAKFSLERLAQGQGKLRGAAERRDRPGGEHPAASGRDHRQASEALPVDGAVDPHDPAHDLLASDGRAAQGNRTLQRPDRRQARPSGDRLRDRRRRAHQDRA